MKISNLKNAQGSSITDTIQFCWGGYYIDSSTTSLNWALSFKTIYGVVAQVSHNGSTAYQPHRLPYDITNTGFTFSKASTSYHWKAYYIAFGKGN